MSDDAIRVDGAKKTEPHPDKGYAEKGASTPAPIPEHKLPDRDREMRKARAILDGRDPEVAALVDEVKESGGLVQVAKDGETIDVDPATLDAHMAAGWRIVDADRADAARAARDDEPDGPFVHPPRDDADKPSKADAPKPADKPKSK